MFFGEGGGLSYTKCRADGHPSRVYEDSTVHHIIIITVNHLNFLVNYHLASREFRPLSMIARHVSRFGEDVFVQCCECLSSFLLEPCEYQSMKYQNMCFRLLLLATKFASKIYSI